MSEETKAIEKQEAAPLEGTEYTRERPRFVPRADIYETEDKVVVLVDMPGVDANSVDITLERNILSIRGFVESVMPENYALAWAEYRDGDYERRFTLSNEIDREGIEAVVKDGVLHLHLPKSDMMKNRKITIKGN